LKALITGVEGFCGRHLARRLVNEGKIHVLGIDRAEDCLDKQILDEYVNLDLTDQKGLTNLIRRFRPDWVFHLAGLANGAANEIYCTNVVGSLYLLEAVRLYAPQARILMTGTAAEYGPVKESDLPVTENHPCAPIGSYGVSKYAMTMIGLDYARCFGLRVVISRAFNVIGPGLPSSLLIGAVIKQIRRKFSKEGDVIVKVGNIHTKRDFIDVNDVVDAYIRLVKGSNWGEVFNICSGRPYAISEVIDLLLSNSARPIKVEVDPALIRSSDIPLIYGSWVKANQAIGFKPVTNIKETLKNTWLHEMKRFL